MKSTNKTSNKWTTKGKPNIPEEESNNLITPQAFDSPTRKFETDTNCVTPIAYEVKYHPYHEHLLKILLYTSIRLR